MKYPVYPRQAARLIEQSGHRATAARIRVLAVLLSRHNAASHHEIEDALGREKMDRVTLYRVLDWLIDKELAHRLTSEDRVWRFLANAGETSAHHHAHFKCTGCDKVICLEDVPVEIDLPMPKGYRIQETELTVKGLCAQCS
jgi:Fur family ferric uptake transcriptional regulator